MKSAGGLSHVAIRGMAHVGRLDPSRRLVLQILVPLVGYLVLKDRGPFIRSQTATVKAGQGQWYQYPMAIRFVS